MRIVFVGGTGPVGQAAIAHLDGHDVAVAHSGAHEAVPHVEHLHGSREELLADGGPVERWTPDVVVDTFPGGVDGGQGTPARPFGVDGFDPAELPLDTLPLTEGHPRRPPNGRDHDNVSMEDALAGAPRITILRPGRDLRAARPPAPHARVVPRRQGRPRRARVDVAPRRHAALPSRRPGPGRPGGGERARPCARRDAGRATSEPTCSECASPTRSRPRVRSCTGCASMGRT